MKKKVKRAKHWKNEQITDLKSLMDAYLRVGIAKIRGLGSNQIQQMRKDLRDRLLMRVSRNSLISILLRESGMEDMADFIDDQMTLIFTNLDAFELYNLLEDRKIPAQIKAGAIAPCDIVIERGPTSLRPGPIVGELQNLGIPAGIEGGKVVIKQQKIVVKEAEKVPASLAKMLARLDIYPVKEGLDLLGVYDRAENVFFTADILNIDLAKYFSEVQEAAKAAFSLSTQIRYEYPTQYTIAGLLCEAKASSIALAVKVAYPTAEIIQLLVQKAYLDAKNFSLNANIYSKDTMPSLIVKATAQAQCLAAYVSTGE